MCDELGEPRTTDLPPSEVDWFPVAVAAFDHVARWIDGGSPPPSQPLTEIADTDGRPTIVRDEHGNARGGIRLPELEVPVATTRPGRMWASPGSAA